MELTAWVERTRSEVGGWWPVYAHRPGFQFHPLLPIQGPRERRYVYNSWPSPLTFTAATLKCPLNLACAWQTPTGLIMRVVQHLHFAFTLFSTCSSRLFLELRAIKALLSLRHFFRLAYPDIKISYCLVLTFVVPETVSKKWRQMFHANSTISLEYTRCF